MIVPNCNDEISVIIMLVEESIATRMPFSSLTWLNSSLKSLVHLARLLSDRFWWNSTCC